MITLGLEFRFDLLGFEPRPFAGVLPIDQLQVALGGLVGDLGYFTEAEAKVEGTIVRTAGGEAVVNGRLTVDLGFDCVRCLTRRTLPVALAGQYVLVKASQAAGEGDAAVEVDESEIEAPEDYSFDGETIKLAEVFREELVLAVGMNPHCADAGEAECAAPEQAAAPEDTIDPRWAPLLALKQKLATGSSEN